jgi:hypothetical protein
MRTIHRNGSIQTIAGTPAGNGKFNGDQPDARMAEINASSFAYAEDGNIYLADGLSNAVRILEAHASGYRIRTLTGEHAAGDVDAAMKNLQVHTLARDDSTGALIVSGPDALYRLAPDSQHAGRFLVPEIIWSDTEGQSPMARYMTKDGGSQLYIRSLLVMSSDRILALTYSDVWEFRAPNEGGTYQLRHLYRAALSNKNDDGTNPRAPRDMINSFCATPGDGLLLASDNDLFFLSPEDQLTATLADVLAA